MKVNKEKLRELKKEVRPKTEEKKAANKEAIVSDSIMPTCSWCGREFKAGNFVLSVFLGQLTDNSVDGKSLGNFCKYSCMKKGSRELHKARMLAEHQGDCKINNKRSKEEIVRYENKRLARGL